MEFSHELALALYQSTEQFPVDFEDGWRWIGYATKQKAKDKLVNNFEAGVDYMVLLNQTVKRTGRGGHNKEKIHLSIDCLKSLGMMAGTQKGKEIRRYFLDCERIAKSASEVIPAQSARIRELELELELARAQDSAARSQEKMMLTTQAIATLHGSGMVALILGKPDAVIERVTEVEKTVLCNERGQPLKTFKGLSKTKLAKRYGLKKPQDFVAWLHSLGKAELLQKGLTTTPCEFVPWEFVKELDQAWSDRQGSRQRLIGE